MAVPGIRVPPPGIPDPSGPSPPGRSRLHPASTTTPWVGRPEKMGLGLPRGTEQSWVWASGARKKKLVTPPGSTRLRAPSLGASSHAGPVPIFLSPTPAPPLGPCKAQLPPVPEGDKPLTRPAPSCHYLLPNLRSRASRKSDPHTRVHTASHPLTALDMQGRAALLCPPLLPQHMVAVGDTRLALACLDFALL